MKNQRSMNATNRYVQRWEQKKEVHFIIAHEHLQEDKHTPDHLAIDRVPRLLVLVVRLQACSSDLFLLSAKKLLLPPLLPPACEKMPRVVAARSHQHG